MATFLQLSLITVLLASFYFGRATAFGESASAPSSPASETSLFPFLSNDVSHVANLLEPILTNLGFQELAMAVPTLSDTAAFTTWNGPSTLFAPNDAALKSCSASSCSFTQLLREHIVPGLFSQDYLKKLAFGTKIETMDPGRCITVTSATDYTMNATKIFVGGVEVTRPDLFNNGLVVIHGLQGFIAPLSPFSCNVERMNSLPFPYQPHHHPTTSFVPNHLMRLMLRDAMLRLRSTGFGVLSLALKLKYAEIANLSNMTVFALDDQSIISGSHAYVSNVRFHIVPNKLLAIFDLEKLPVGTVLPTLEKGQSLVVTAAGGGAAPIRINYVRVKVPDVIRNLKIVVHSVYLPFPHVHKVGAMSYEGLSDLTAENNSVRGGSCGAVMEDGGGVCGGEVAPIPAQVNQPVVDHMDDHHGL